MIPFLESFLPVYNKQSIVSPNCQIPAVKSLCGLGFEFSDVSNPQVKSSGIRVGLSKRKRSERKVTRMVSIVVAVFVLCWLPFYSFNVTSVASSISPTPALKSTFDFVVVLGYANSCANPILYAFLSDNFKKSFQNVLCLKKVSGLDEMERSDSRADRSQMVHDAVINANLEIHNAALLSSELQTSI